MAAVEHEHAQAEAAEAVAAPVHVPAAPLLGSGLTPGAVLRLQRAAGNAAVSRILARTCGDDCDCVDCAPSSSASPESTQTLLLDPAHEAEGLKASSKVKNGRLDPTRTITGIVLCSYTDYELAKQVVEGSKVALAPSGIALDLTVKPFLELGDLDMEDTTHGGRGIGSYAKLDSMLPALEPLRSVVGVFVLVAPFSGEVCGSHGKACYISDLKNRCPSAKTTNKLILVGTHGLGDDLPQVLAHELGHHAGQPQPGDPSTWGHEEHDKGNFMNYGAGRNHYRSELLARFGWVPFQF